MSWQKEMPRLLLETVKQRLLLTPFNRLYLLDKRLLQNRARRSHLTCSKHEKPAERYKDKRQKFHERIVPQYHRPETKNSERDRIKGKKEREKETYYADSSINQGITQGGHPVRTILGANFPGYTLFKVIARECLSSRLEVCVVISGKY